jgi:hypothetical protein
LKRAGRTRQCRDPRVNLLPMHRVRERPQRQFRQFNAQIDALRRIGLDNLAGRAAAKECAQRIGRTGRGRQADPLYRLRRQSVQPGQRQRQVRPALGTRQGMQFIDNDGLDGCKQPPPAGAAQQHVERFRRGRQDFRRAPALARALRLRRVAAAKRHFQWSRAQLAGEFQQRRQVDRHVAR